MHDSAYKKRDKGAAHHQKFKKHEANSEGHHGSVHEHHKKSHKKEEKKSKMEEKKKEIMGKDESEKAKKQKKASKNEMAGKKAKKHKQHEEKNDHQDHDQEESSPTVASIGEALGTFGANQFDELDDSPPDDRSKQAGHPNTTRPQPASMQIGSSTLRPSILPLSTTATHASQPVNMIPFLPTDQQDYKPSKHGLEPRSSGASQHQGWKMRLGQAADLKNISRRSSSDEGLSLNMDNSTLVDILNRLKSDNRQQSGKNETRSETAKAEDVRNVNVSPLLKLINGMAKQHTETSQREHLQQKGSALPFTRAQTQTPIRGAPSMSTPELDRNGGTSSSNDGNFNRSLDRMSRALAHLSQVKLSEPLNRPLNPRADSSGQLQSFELSGPLRPSDVVAAGQRPATDPNPFNGLFRQLAIQQHASQPNLYKTHMKLHQNLPPMPQQHMYPSDSFPPPQQLAETSNRMELLDQLNAFDFDPDQLSQALPPALVSPLFSNPQFPHPPFGGDFITE